MTEPQYRGVTVDTRYTPLPSIIPFVEGSSWVVNYYSQVIDEDNELSPQQTSRSPVYQQYRLIEALELKVTAALSQSQDNEGKNMMAVGSATVYAAVIPNKGDTFLADIGDGREGVFAITTVEKKTYLKQAAYVIEYELKDYSTPEIRDDLARKTVLKTRFVRDMMFFGQNPVIASEDYTAQIDLKQQYKTLLGLYLSDFFSVEHQTLLIPDQELVSYDPFLTKAIVEWVGTDEHPYVNRIRLPNVSGDQAMNVTTLWDCLSRMSDDLLPMALWETQLVNTKHFKSIPQYGGVYFTQLDQVLYPFDGRTDVDVGYNPAAMPAPNGPVTIGGRRSDDITRLVPSRVINGFQYEVNDNELPDIIRVTDDPYYVFSEAFYKGQTPLRSNLERLALQALRQQPIERDTLARLAAQAMKWENVERFYYIPILFALIKVALRTN